MIADDLSTLEQLLKDKQSSKQPRSVTTISTVFGRSQDVIAYARKRTGLSCDVLDCDHNPFSKLNGDAYVEIHQIATLVDGGLDTIENVASRCPAHHRRFTSVFVADHSERCYSESEPMKLSLLQVCETLKAEAAGS